MKIALTERQKDNFWRRCVRQASGCMEWQGATLNRKWNYGQVRFNNKTYLAHRVAFFLTAGELPDSVVVRHRCDNPRCCNPEHLIPGTHQDNMTDMVTRNRSLKGVRRVTPERQARGRALPQTKLSFEQVAEIRKLYATGGWLQRELGVKFGVDTSTISYVVNGKVHKCVPSL